MDGCPSIALCCYRSCRRPKVFTAFTSIIFVAFTVAFVRSEGKLKSWSSGLLSEKGSFGEKMREISRESSSTRSIPATLPPPYTSTGTRTGSLRSHASSFTITAEILVGPKPTRFLLHTHLLTSQSPYFRACLKTSFLESTTQSVTLADVSVDTFELLVQWLYQGCLSPPPFIDGKPAYYSLLNLWILADRLCFEGLRNYIVDVMSDLADSTNSVLTPSDTWILYEHIGDEAKIRHLVLDLFAFKKTDKLLDTHVDRWHARFLRDLVVRLKKPCEQAMQRHTLRMWCPTHWLATRPCDNCCTILRPHRAAIGCDECCIAFCLSCTQDGTAMASWEEGRKHPQLNLGVPVGPTGDAFLASGYGSVEGRVDQPRYVEGEKVAKLARWSGKQTWESCKPWRGSRCRVYHEHRETDACGDVFMGR